MAERVVVGTRSSALAMAQTETVVAALRQAHPDIEFEIKTIRTGGDRDQKTPLAQIGGQGIFVKEIEQGLQSGDIDLAVHSLKDMPGSQPDDLCLAAILPREDARDVLVSRLGSTLVELPEGARVGTGSLRRQVQLRIFRPDLEVIGLRGNVDTRLRKSGTEEYDAVVLAFAGLRRLGLADHVTEILPLDLMLPAVGQGAIVVETRADDTRTIALTQRLDDEATRVAVEAERSFLRELGGGCHVPIAAHARPTEHSLWLRGLVADPEGRQVLRGAIHGPRDAASELGRDLARQLIGRGAGSLLGLTSD